MYQASRPLFIYCVSPVHMGAGTAIGAIDNPIQRERHTEHPMLPGSGLKGALRHRVQAGGWDKKLVDRLFGPEARDSNLHAGALSIGDGQLVAFPVRCTRSAFVYATCATAFERTRRLIGMLLGEGPTGWPDAPIAPGACGVANDGLLDDGKLHLEFFEYEAREDEAVSQMGAWLAANALPGDAAYDYFRRKLQSDLVVLPDEDFGHFVRNATVVEPHVRINNETGAADRGGLFYTENLPPESLLVAPLMASRERGGNGAMEAAEVLRCLLHGPDGEAGVDGALVQIGGHATNGRGHVLMTTVEG